MEYDDFSHDNNPFAGSNHFYSNGILESDSIDNFNITTTSDNNLDNEYDSHSQFESISHLYNRHIDNNEGDNTINNTSNDNDTNNDTSNDTDSDSDNDNDEIESHDPANETTASIEQPTFYNPIISFSMDSSNSAVISPFIIKTFEIIQDYKGTKTVFYKIENNLNNTFVFRRYNDFKSLRTYLCKFYPYLFIPPIPEKHSISRFLKNPFNYKNDISIIELRIRLLNYFLKKINSIEKIANSVIISKFQDPLNTNWSDCLKYPPFTNLSSNSILLISTKNPTKPSPYFSFLPIPPLTLLKKFQTDLNSNIFQNLEYKLKFFLKLTVNLELRIKKIIKTLQSLRLNSVELGGFLNIFSIIENQNRNIEKFGNKIDLNFLNIEILINNLIIKIKEPIIIIKNSIIYLLQMLHFRKLKELQMVYFENIIIRKQKKLLSLIKSIKSKNNLNKNLSNIETNSPSLNIAIENMRKKDENLIKSNHNISLEARQLIINEIKNLNTELNKNLIPCFNMLSDDVNFLSTQVEQNVNIEFEHLITMLNILINDWKSHVWFGYVDGCLQVWGGKECVKN